MTVSVKGTMSLGPFFGDGDRGDRGGWIVGPSEV